MPVDKSQQVTAHSFEGEQFHFIEPCLHLLAFVYATPVLLGLVSTVTRDQPTEQMLLQVPFAFVVQFLFFNVVRHRTGALLA
jgi:hypothetical protein